MKLDKNQQAFFTLIRAGLWEREAHLVSCDEVDFTRVLQMAEEQSLVGLVASGIERVVGVKPSKKTVLQFVGRTVQLEQRNIAMNSFIEDVAKKMRDAGICTVLVKGQGVAQCYERPLWRSSGDVDFFMDEDNYNKAKAYLIPRALSIDEEDSMRLHLGMTIGPWVVELHGTMHSGISERMNTVLNHLQKEIFEENGVRVWHNGTADVLLPNPDNDVVIIFTHYIGHFYVGGIGFRQICDWCRLLWTYRESISLPLLERRLREMELMTEWKAFAALAVEWLGMPVEAMPFYSTDGKWKRKAGRICHLILKVGNFGQNLDNSYRTKYPWLVEKVITFHRRLIEFAHLTTLFPKNAPKFFVTYVNRRVRSV